MPGPYKAASRTDTECKNTGGKFQWLKLLSWASARSVPACWRSAAATRHPSPAASVSRSRSNTSWMCGISPPRRTPHCLPTPSTRSLNDPEIKVVVETIGGTRFAYPYVRQCLESGRSVCTSNKEMVATYGAELLALAKEHNAAFLFEASVGGGTPIITPMHQCLAANHISQIQRHRQRHHQLYADQDEAREHGL